MRRAPSFAVFIYIDRGRVSDRERESERECVSDRALSDTPSFRPLSRTHIHANTNYTHAQSEAANFHLTRHPFSLTHTHTRTHTLSLSHTHTHCTQAQSEAAKLFFMSFSHAHTRVHAHTCSLSLTHMHTLHAGTVRGGKALFDKHTLSHAHTPHTSTG